MSQEFCPSSFPTILELYSSDSKMTINVDTITEDDIQFLQGIFHKLFLLISNLHQVLNGKIYLNRLLIALSHLK